MSLSAFEILSEIGNGAYSTVYKVRRISDQQTYALKKVKIQTLNSKEKKNALNEVRILASVHHPNIISYKEAFFDESGCLNLVMEYANNGDLYEKILKYQQKNKYFKESFIWSVLHQVATALKVLHNLNILHRDMKSANVFLNKDGSIKQQTVTSILKPVLPTTQAPKCGKTFPTTRKATSGLWAVFSTNQPLFTLPSVRRTCQGCTPVF
jgi:NIMA (never in mitosis gene a)-related kinase 1/4/5